jgi:glucokinase
MKPYSHWSSHVLRHTNAVSIYALAPRGGSCSRADLVRATGLSAPTVTNVVKDLLSKNLVEPLGEGESSGGRPPDKLRFKAERGCILAATISTSGISFLLTDLNGNQLDSLKIALTRRKTAPTAICSYIGQAIERLLRRQKKSLRQLLTLIVGVPLSRTSRKVFFQSVPLRVACGPLRHVNKMVIV